MNSGKEKDEMNLIQIDTRFLKEKKNFNYIGKMTILISALLIVFAILAISLFISNLLKTHLNKVKMNLGTYKAFGLSDKESVNIYLQIMLRFIGISLIFSFAIAYIIGSFLEIWIGLSLNINEDVKYFKLVDTLTFLLIAVIIIVTTLVSYININRILSKTPGDLIYNR